MLLAGEGQVAHDVQAVPAADRPARDHRDDDLGHVADEALHLEDVQAAEATRIDVRAVGVLVAVAAADPLIAAGAEGPAPVLGGWAVPREQDAADVGRHPGVVEGGVQLVDGLGSEGVAHLRAVEGDADRAHVDGAVVGDVGELEAGHRLPCGGVEDL